MSCTMKTMLKVKQGDQRIYIEKGPQLNTLVIHYGSNVFHRNYLVTR